MPLHVPSKTTTQRLASLHPATDILFQTSAYPSLVLDVTPEKRTHAAMGRNKRATNLLPKRERTLPTSKITTMTVEPAQPFHRRTAPARRVPRLDDESLGRVLRFSGAATMLRARCVCTQWRRVADDHLRSLRTVDVTRLFPAQPTPRILRNAMRSFQHTEGFVIRKWPYTHIFPCVVEEIAHAALPALKQVEIADVYVTPAVIVELVKRSSVKLLTIGGHDSVDANVMKALINAQSKYRETHSYLLDRLTVRHARRVESSHVSGLSRFSIAKELVITKCPNVKDVNLKCVSLGADRSSNLPEMYAITSCENLNTVDVSMCASRNDCSYLNFSQCPMLSSLSFSVNDVSIQDENIDVHIDLKELNLSGCRRLQTIDLCSQGHVRIRLSNLERLILFGARALRKAYIYHIFALDRETPIMPKLQRLDLNGTSIDKLELNGYPELAYVDVSGCPFLNVVIVRNCWKLQSFSILGKRAPLHSVHIVLPATCRFEGRRDQWHWSIRHSHQEILFP